jgi:hypothetical protein
LGLGYNDIAAEKAGDFKKDFHLRGFFDTKQKKDKLDRLAWAFYANAEALSFRDRANQYEAFLDHIREQHGFSRHHFMSDVNTRTTEEL